MSKFRCHLFVVAGHARGCQPCERLPAMQEVAGHARGHAYTVWPKVCGHLNITHICANTWV